jgi:hypothetical protein
VGNNQNNNYLGKKKHSIFSVSNISANIVDNVLQDMNYTMKGSKEN